MGEQSPTVRASVHPFSLGSTAMKAFYMAIADRR
jgi:hypothetical protein